MLHNTRPFNFPALTTISVPCGFTHSRLPIGIQISARAVSPWPTSNRRTATNVNQI